MLEIVRRRWRLGLAVFLVPLSAVVSLALFLPRVYRASTVVLVDRQQVPETFVRSTVTSALETRLQSISQEVLKRGRLEELIQRFDLYPELRASKSMEAVTERMRRDIRIERVTDPVVRGGAIVAFTVSYTGRDPETVAAVANTLASLYLTENSRVREEEASGTAGFLRKQLEDVKKRLEDQEARVSAFKRRHIGENPKNMDANLAVLERLTAQLRLNSDNQNRALERREALARQLAGSEGMVPAAVGVAGRSRRRIRAAVRLARLHQELAELQTRFSDKYPDVVRLKAEIAALEAQMRDAPGDGRGAGPTGEPLPNPFTFKLRQAIAEVEAEIAALRIEERRLREDFAHVPAPRGEHAAAGAGVPGAVPRLRDDERALPDAAQALRGGSARRDPGAAPEGRAVPDPRGGDPADARRRRRTGAGLLLLGGVLSAGSGGRRGAAGRSGWTARSTTSTSCGASPTSPWSRGSRGSSAKRDMAREPLARLVAWACAAGGDGDLDDGGRIRHGQGARSGRERVAHSLFLRS